MSLNRWKDKLSAVADHDARGGADEIERRAQVERDRAHELLGGGQVGGLEEDGADAIHGAVEAAMPFDRERDGGVDGGGVGGVERQGRGSELRPESGEAALVAGGQHEGTALGAEAAGQRGADAAGAAEDENGTRGNGHADCYGLRRRPDAAELRLICGRPRRSARGPPDSAQGSASAPRSPGRSRG